MGRYTTLPWAPADGFGLPRVARKYARFDAYLPDTIADRSFTIDGAVSADVADAERAIGEFDTTAATLTHTEAIARLLLRAESVASSRIEGLTAEPRRLLHADLEMSGGGRTDDVTATEIFGNIEAMEFAVKAVDAGAPITIDLLLETHRRLMGHTKSAMAGVLRVKQNWLGGNPYNPVGADFVPPPPDRVPALMDDLCAFCEEDALPVVAQAAIAHSQFETIHPFADGNGRVGRTLIHMVMRRRGLTKRVLPPISLVLAQRVDAYIAGLRATSYVGGPNSAAAVEGINAWLGTFAAACSSAVHDALLFEKTVAQMKRVWRDRLGTIRAKSAADVLIDVLPGSPIASLATLVPRVGRSLARVAEAVDRFIDAGIIIPLDAGRQRARIFEVPEVIDAFTDFERGLTGVPGGPNRGSDRPHLSP